MTDRKALELQCNRIERVLVSHKAPVRVTGGIVTPRAVQFHLAPASGTRISKVQALSDELALALGVSSVRMSRQGGSLQLDIPRDDAQPVKLLSLMTQLAHPRSGPLPSGTAVLGLCDDGAPLLLRLPLSDVAHVLISGMPGSGKTALCQTIILSLAMTHRRSQVQFVMMASSQCAFKAFVTLLHLLRPVVPDPQNAADALAEIARVMETRGMACPHISPRIVVVVDELMDLLTQDKTAGDVILRLTQHGREAGIHVIACTREPAHLEATLRASFPVRLAGKAESPENARLAAGIGGTGAEKLDGRGDFVAVAAGQVLRFQGAYLGQGEMEQVVAHANAGSAPRRWDIRGHPSLLQQAAALVASVS